ncbi:unnamed protein product [Medioppia subpectinata]|uniref:Uncharacterized protein n=1 Tax=Medioppia subpectinata TaxID=1979941 RepID=A0A7R9KBH5_9ACAR|nr:unnamed protein product [Medioppia subpectinata]CAG2100354.1 unnamed protein product [Medioppia subpectinata]
MKLLLTLTLMAIIGVSFAQYFIPGQTVYTGVGEIGLDGHSKISYHGYNNPANNPYGYASNGFNYGYNYFRRR